MVRKFLLLSFLLGGSLLPLSAAKKAELPDWAKSALQNKPTQELSGKPTALKLLDATSLTVTAKGKSILRKQSVVKILRQQGKEEAQCSTFYDVDQKLNYMRAWTVAPDEKVYAAEPSDFADIGLEDGIELQFSARIRKLHPPAADIGAIVACESEVELRSYINEEIWQFQDSIPVVRGTFELQLPPGWQYYSAWKSYPSVTPKEISQNNWRWEVQDVPALDLEDVPLAPAWRALAARASIHYGPSLASTDVDQRWQAIGVWQQQLAQHRTDASPQIEAKSHALADGETDFFAKIQRITEDIQKNIRYFVIEVGIGGYQPHFAKDIFRNQYGDCKDKATILISMLHVVGIEANYVLVDTHRGVIDPKVPSIAGNHMIAAIQIPEGYKDPRLQSVVESQGRRYLIFDPTDTTTPVGSVRPALQGGYGLLITEKNSKPVEIPLLAPVSNVLTRKGTLELTTEGTIKGLVSESRSGAASLSLRYRYTNEDEKKINESLEHRLRRDLPSLTLSEIVAKNVKERSKPLELSYVISCTGYAKKAGGLLLIRPRVIGSDTMPFDKKVRKYPIDLEETGTWKDIFDVQLPEGYVADELPEPVDLDMDFASYHSSVTTKNNVLHYERSYVVKKVDLPAASFQQVQNLMGTIAGDEQATAIFKKK